MCRNDLIRLLARLPNYSDQHTLSPMDMAFLTEIRLKVASNVVVTDVEQRRLMEIEQGYTEV